MTNEPQRTKDQRLPLHEGQPPWAVLEIACTEWRRHMGNFVI